MKRRIFTFAIGGIVSGALVIAGCGSSKGASLPSSSKNTFLLSEFTVIAPTNTMHAGSVEITANNVGGELHELVIVRAESVGALPRKADGSVDEDKIAEIDKVGEIEDVAAGSHKSKPFDLTTGKYVAFCNVVDEMMGSSPMHGSSGMSSSGMGHVHFAEGMHATFTVT